MMAPQYAGASFSKCTGNVDGCDEANLQYLQIYALFRRHLT